MDVKEIISYLKGYDGPEIKIMEVCGTHTASIFKNGIRSLISPNIKLISGPGCPVCVTPSSFIDKCLEYAVMDNHALLTFGDMMKVPGTEGSLSDWKGRNATVELMYSPLEAVSKAKENPDITYVIAAVGFETTVPAYALTVQEARKNNLTNLKLITAIKTIIPALAWICENQRDLAGFICPGHVSVIIGSDIYGQLAAKYHKPFVVAGFEAEHILAVIYDIVKQFERNAGKALNFYKSAVRDKGNIKAQKLIAKYFEKGPAVWRGLGEIADSGLYLRHEFASYDGGSRGLDTDLELPDQCRCASVIVGEIDPSQCPMFGKACTPMKPFGPCMVSAEGACGIWYRNKL